MTKRTPRRSQAEKNYSPAHQPLHPLSHFTLGSPGATSAKRAATASAQVSPIMEKLSAYIAGALNKRLPAVVVQRAKLHLLDALSAMISGSRLLPGQRAIQFVKMIGGTPEAGVVGTRLMTSAINAALANGIFGHADETDDWHQGSITHPGCSVVPAALAMAERNRCSGTALLRAVVLGYDLGTRLAMALDAFRSFMHGHHPSSLGDRFGAAAAAGALAELDAERVRYMLSYAAQQASGLASLLRDPHHIEKAFGIGGMPAQNGVQAALMAAHGFTGVADVFSGDRNFLAVYAPDPHPAELVRELGKTYEIMNTSIKKWAVGAPILAPLDAIQTLMHSHGFDAQDVERLIVRVGKREAAIVDGRAMPDINLQHMVAVMLLDGTVSFEAAHDFERTRDPKLLALKRRIELVASEALSTPSRRWHGDVEITLRDGRILRHYAPGARGSSHNPLTPEEENAKAIDLIVPVLGRRRGELLIDVVWNIEGMKDMRELRTLYRA